MIDLLQFTIKKDGEYQKKLIECIELKNKEIERLNNIINEFEKYLEESKSWYEEYTCAIRKLKELKGADKE